MEAAKSFTDLLVWRRAHALVLQIYQVSRTFPREETYGLTIQLRRAAVSVAANIAEGFRRRGRADKAKFFNTAEGSLDETRYLLMLASDLGYADTRPMEPELEQVSRLLRAYARTLRTPPS